MKTAFQIDKDDNVATALQEIAAGEEVRLTGEGVSDIVLAVTDVPRGHKIALKDINIGESVIKYHVVIGSATANISAGSWVHLHVMRSNYDERSSHLDAETGAPGDVRYE